ncbi:MAG: hypothetical protein JKX70_03685 [Phycisphaerales bacterium]|nr:hypothetical protein [Phycisphaerales bacterium]
MRTQEYDQFWKLYEQRARLPLERACLFASRTKTDSTMDIADMIAWIDTRIWTMLKKQAWPTFHDDPTPEQAIERIIKHASTLARWAYLGLCRSHFRRLENRANYTGGMSRAQRLSMASSVDTPLEKREELDSAIASLRKSLSANDKQKLAASWIDKEDRSRVAMVLGATRKEDDRMITKVSGNGMNENAVQQMRSRARKRAQEVLNAASKLPLILIAFVMIVSVGFTTSSVQAGEQSGGRRGLTGPISNSLQINSSGYLHRGPIVPGEQTGGRKP